MCRFFNISLLGLLLFMALPSRSHATHLMGGELTYTYDGSTTGGDFYIVKLIVYRYCDTTTAPTAQLDQSMMLGIYPGDPANPGLPLNWFSTETLTLISSDFVTADPGNPLCSFSATACIQRGEYTTTLLLPTNAGGYHLIVERCCRNNNISNITSPGAAGMTFYAFVPPGIVNSTPQITDVSIPYLCAGDTVSLVNNAYDPDGDSLVYAFVVPYNGYSNGITPMPDPLLDNNPYQLPVPPVTFSPGYSLSTPFGAGSYASIDPVTGLTEYFVPNQGFYVAAIEILEYRGGVLINTMRRDLQFIAIICPQNTLPQYDVASAPGTVFSVGEGQTLCFPATFTDADGDSLYLTPSGTLLDPLLVNPPGTMAPAAGLGSVTGQFCWTPTCGMARSAPYQFTITVTDNGCPSKSTSEVFSVYVTAGPASLFPTVAIAQTPPGLLCQGSLTSFVANATLSGNNPSFFWAVNGVPAGTDSSIFSSSALNDGDVLTVMMISNATCLFTDTAYSAPFVINMSSQPAPQVSITSNPSGTLCPQQICLFSSSISNGGAAPVYQWHINGNPAGTNNPQFTAANPSGIMSVYVTLTPSTGCPPQNSNTIIFNIQPYLSPDIILTASETDSVCPGQPVSFQVTSTATGNPPYYNWYLNGTSVATGTDSLSLPLVQEGDEVTVSVTSSYPCLSPVFTYADPLDYHIYPPLAADLTDGPLELCLGTPLPLEMQAQGGNTSTIVYSWSTGASQGSAVSFTPVTSGYYFATADDDCYAPITDSLFVEVLPVPLSDFSWAPEKPSVFMPLVTFTDLSVDAISWQWDFGDQTLTQEQHPEHNYPYGGQFPVTLVTTNDVGCTDTAVKILEVEEFITVYIPNSFTPNGDSKNDTFGMTGFATGGYQLNVYNRWGQEVFRSSGDFDAWDGTFNGMEAPAGIYTYLLRVNNDPSQKPFTGTITLIR